MQVETQSSQPEKRVARFTREIVPGLISVIIPAYNHEKYVQQAIRSIIEQSYPDIELIVVDDGSTDATYAKILEMEAECRKRFVRVEFKTQANRGTCITLNRLMGLSQGEYVYLIASDDMAKPNAFATLYSFLHDNPDYVLAVGDNVFINENDEEIVTRTEVDGKFILYETFGAALQFTRPDMNFCSSDFGTFHHLVTANHVPNGYLLRNSALRELAPFTPDAPLEDYYLMLQLSLKGKFKFLVDELFSYRKHGTNVSLNTEKMDFMTEKTLRYTLKMLGKMDALTPMKYSGPNYAPLVTALQGKCKAGKKIRVGFFVVFDSVFPAKPLFERMLADDMFAPTIVVIPDVHRGRENMLDQMHKSLATLSEQYRAVVCGYDEDKDTVIDFGGFFDMICFMNPYEGMTHPFFQLSYWQNKALTFYIYYGYMNSKYSADGVRDPFFSNIWKNYINSPLGMQEMLSKQLDKGKNAVLSGYCKMDDYARLTPAPHERKRIIIAPHHTVDESIAGINLGNFLEYHDFLLELPTRYPDVDFVFRPHPLLSVRLKKEDMWGQEKTDKYFQALCAHPNVTLSEGGDYLQLFMDSDALIHDCGSFTAEYLFTGKPCCYVLRSLQSAAGQFNSGGMACLGQHYHAFSKEDITAFIDTVVIGGDDSKKEEREHFANQNLKVNFPNATGFILDDLKRALRQA